MKISSKLDIAASDKLADEFHKLVAATEIANPDITQNDVISALMRTIASVLIHIPVRTAGA